MNQEELAKCWVLIEQNRRLRRRCEALEAENEMLRKAQNKISRAFDEENREMFAVISRNHADKATHTETFYFGN